ncbi:MAG: hypothetical protein GVY16_05405 [Planctomycetes bacterium]|jgi:hypothetical protein|nr:cob(I)yrinic acid a,c-diamide adenosyltransferase [Phycisphaerae bacterium]NBB95159.1 hypothetical protein [Planctomycetota bacterium]
MRGSGRRCGRDARDTHGRDARATDRRDVTEPIIDAADLVTEMQEIKHYYHAGTGACVGIEM